MEHRRPSARSRIDESGRSRPAGRNSRFFLAIVVGAESCASAQVSAPQATHTAAAMLPRDGFTFPEWKFRNTYETNADGTRGRYTSSDIPPRIGRQQIP